MVKYRYIIFDLDGTLINTEKSIMESARYSLERQGIIEKNDNKLRRFIGPPLLESYMSLYNFSVDQAENAIIDFQSAYNELYKNASLYPEIKDLLVELKNMGCLLSVATVTPSKTAMKLLAYFNVLTYFEGVFGGDNDAKSPKHEALQNAVMYANNIHHDILPTEMLVVGDRNSDVLEASTMGIGSVGVTYGFASNDEFKDTDAICFIDHPMELITIIKNN